MKILIYGAGGFGREVRSYLGEGEFMVDDEYIYYQDWFPLSKFNPALYKVIVAIGDPVLRKQAVEKLSINTVFGGVNINHYQNKTVVQCPGSFVTVNVKIGEFVIINLNATIGHDCVIGDFVTISPGANLSGNVTVGNLCYVGSNACIREGVTICDNVIIGMGAVVLHDITEPGTYVGNPIHKIK